MTTRRMPDDAADPRMPDLFRLRRGLAFAEMEQRIGLAYAGAGLRHRVVAFYLEEIDARGLHQLVGCRTAAQYASTRFGMSRREARELLRAGRALRELPAIDGAFAEGRLCWSKVRELVKVATPPHDAAWLERALRTTIDELCLEVRLARRGEAPRDRDDRKGLPEIRLKVEAELPPDVYAKWEAVRKKLAAEANQPLADWECLEALIDLGLAHRDGKAPQQDDGHATAGPSAPSHPVVIHRSPDGGPATVETEDGPVPLDAQSEAMLACGADHVDAGAESGPGDRRIPVARRRYVLARDGFACRACRGRLRLHTHHVVPVSEGGCDESANLLTLCRRCHALVHAGLLSVEGDAGECRFLDREGRDVHGNGEAPAGTPAPEGRTLSLPELPAAEAGIPRERALVRLADVPARLDAAWWRRHRHLLRYNERRRSLELQPGSPREELGDVERHARDGAPTTRNGERGTMCRARARRNGTPGLDDLIGQRRAVATLRLAARVAREYDEPLGHVLLSGGPGLGKTTLGRAAACELKAGLHAAAGPLVADPLDLLLLLVSLGRHDVLLLDEIHALPRTTLEVLYEALDSRRVSVSLCSGAEARTVAVAVEPFTLIGATTDPGKLPPALVGRFAHRMYLGPYRKAELALIARRAAARKGLDLETGASRRLAAVAQGTPREVLRLLAQARLDALAGGRPAIDGPLVRRTLRRLGIDRLGLRPDQRACLDVLRRAGRPLSRRKLSALLGIDEEALERDVEPGLLALGLLAVTPSGRVPLPAAAARQRRGRRGAAQCAAGRSGAAA